MYIETEVLVSIVIFAIGWVVGVIGAIVYYNTKSPDGVFHIDDAKGIYRLELNDLDDVDRKSRLTITVNKNANLDSLKDEDS